MNKPSISFIIPYYTVELPLLARAITSILRLGQKADWEVWVINDGTPGHEAEDYLGSLDDPRIHYHVQPNLGLGGARNTGMEMAQKEYIQFLDADDFLFQKAFSQILDVLGEKHPDLLSFEFKKVYHTGLWDTNVPAWQTVFQGSGTDFMLKHNLHGCAWGYVFKKSVLDGLRFTSGIYHEDEEFTPLLFLKARHVIITNLPAYAYFQRQYSIIHHPDRKIIKKRYSDLQHIILCLTDKGRQMEGNAAIALNRRIDMLRMSMVYTLLGDSPDTAFLLETLGNMKRTGLYPLTPRFYSFPYTIVRWCTFKPSCAVVLSNMFRLFQLRHAGHAS